MAIEKIIMKILLFVSISNCYYFEDDRPRYLTAGVGDSVMFDCEIDFPQDFPIPYKLYWKRKVNSYFIFILENTKSNKNKNI